MYQWQGDSVFYICEDFTPDVVKSFAEKISFYQPPEPLKVVICSDGGCIYSAMSICDLIEQCPYDIWTVGIGKVFSAGGLVLASGRKRLLFPSAWVMLHEVQVEGSDGPASSIIEDANHTKKLMKMKLERLAQYTGKTFKKLEQDLKTHGSLYFSAQEALAYNLVDGILDEYPFYTDSAALSKARKSKSVSVRNATRKV